MGNGNVPWAASDYAILVGLASIPLSWFSTNKDNERGVMSVIAGVAFTVVALPSFFLFMFALALPGNEASTRELHFPFIMAPLVVSALFIFRKPESARIIGLTVLFSSMLFLISTQIVARSNIQSAIQRVHADGGCVLMRRSENLGLEWQKIQSLWEVPFVIVIGHASYRVSFVAPGGSTQWTYGKMKEVPTEISFSECSK